MDFLPKSLIGSCFRNNANYLDKFRELIYKVKLCLFDTPKVFSDTYPCQVDVLLRVRTVASICDKLSQLFIGLFEVGQLESPRVKDRERNAVFGNLTGSLCYRLSNTSCSKFALEDRIDQSAFANTRPACDQDVYVSTVFHCFFVGILDDLGEVEFHGGKCH